MNAFHDSEQPHLSNSWATPEELASHQLKVVRAKDSNKAAPEAAREPSPFPRPKQEPKGTRPAWDNRPRPPWKQTRFLVGVITKHKPGLIIERGQPRFFSLPETNDQHIVLLPGPSPLPSPEGRGSSMPPQGEGIRQAGSLRPMKAAAELPFPPQRLGSDLLMDEA